MLEITRIGKEKDLKEKVQIIHIKVGDSKFTLSESFGALKINKTDISSDQMNSGINIRPVVSNEIELL